MHDSFNPTVSSGDKFLTADGVVAIKDGIKRAAPSNNPNTQSNQEEICAYPVDRKPPWLRVKIGGGKAFQIVRDTVHANHLNTVCEESHCPNIGECWSHGTATLMLMGSVCTRACKFCAVDTGNPKGRLDPNEPAHAAQSVRLMNLRYVVLTSVDRDDLADGGAQHYADCIVAIKKKNPTTAVEALTPDFSGSKVAVATVVRAGVNVFAQNIESVERLTQRVRDPRAGYKQTLEVLAHAKSLSADLLTKSSLMVGLGETDSEIEQTMVDLRSHAVDVLTIGQYLRPTQNHLPIHRWVTPEQFAHYRKLGLRMGFTEIASGPLVRSSYRADRILDKNNLGLKAIPLQQL